MQGLNASGLTSSLVCSVIMVLVTLKPTVSTLKKNHAPLPVTQFNLFYM